MCRTVDAASGRHRCGPTTIIADVVADGPVLHGGPTGAVVAATAQLGVEGVEDVGVERPDLEPAEEGREVVADVTAIERPRAVRAVELVEVALQQLVDCRVGPRVAALGDLGQQPIPGRTRLALGRRAGWDRLDERVPLLRDGVHSGVDAHPEGAARQYVDAAPLATRGDHPATRHGRTRSAFVSRAVSRTCSGRGR